VTDLTFFKGLSDLEWAHLALGVTPLPPVPPESLQRSWCGNSGAPLAAQSAAFYSILKASHARHGRQPLEESLILDFGCGWGRLTRLFAKDVDSKQIFGCDSDGEILQWCDGLPGTFRQSEIRLRNLPFEERFDLAFAFSVFTHLGPATHSSALDALHQALAPGGLLVVTVRPRAFLEMRASEFAALPEDRILQWLESYDAGEYVYLPHNRRPVEGEVPYGEAVIPDAYLENHWGRRFEILERPSYANDPLQVPVVMRKPLGREPDTTSVR
jgi:SAM-dependent methyltransferase